MGKDHTNYYRVKFTAFAELDGERVDIAGFEANYVLNDIPTIKIWPTVGRDPANDKEAEAVDKFLQASQYTPLKVRAKFETELDSPEGAEKPGFQYDTDVLVFDGYLMGTSYKSYNSPAGGSLVLEAAGAHWLTGLAGTDVHTGGTTVKGPAGWDEVGNPTLEGGANVVDIQASILEGQMGQAVVDLWKLYIKLIFSQIVTKQSVWGDTPNDVAQRALDKMDDDSVFSGGLASNKLALAFGEGAAPADVKEFTSNFVANYVGRTVFDTWRKEKQGSLWAALKAVARSMRFHIVPLIETASCCPVYGALRHEPHRIITADDYTSINLDTNAAMLVTKYGVLGAKGTYSVTRAEEPRETGLIGLGDINEALRLDAGSAGISGQSILGVAPEWLAAEAEIGEITRKSLGVTDEFGIPDAANAKAFKGEPEKDYQILYNKVRTTKLGDNYAKATLQEMNLAPRSGGLKGRFRMDIAPGSLVKFEVINDKFADDDAEPKFMFAMVAGVTLNLSAGRTGPIGNASTTLQLAFVRTEEEQEKDYLTSEVHPMWGQAIFAGAELWTPA